MVHIAKRSRDSKSLAVIRSYHPIRIERELLAQVFDLAERGLATGIGDDRRPDLDADSIDDQGTETSTQRDFRVQGVPQELDLREAVA